MVDRFDLDRLSEWQLGIFAAGCAQRLAPVADVLCWPLPRAVIAACTEAAWAGTGRLAPELAEHLERGVRRLVIVDSIDEFADEIADLLGASALMVTACRTGDPDDSIRVAEQVLTVWDTLDGATPGGNWVAREQQMQQQTLAVLGGLPANEAIALVRALTHDLAQLATATIGAGWRCPASNAGMPSVGSWSPDPASERADHTPTADDLDAPAELLITTSERACPLDERGEPRAPYRPGDVLRLACDFEVTEVVKVSAYDTFVRWPWPRPRHPGTTQTFAHEPARELWTPFALTPPASSLAAGDECHVGIVPTIVYVLQSWTSRRGENLFTALPCGRSAIGGWAEEGGAIDPYDDPIEVSLAHRVYGFLRPGDVVRDAAGRHMAFAPPVLFTDAGGTVRAPRWPLRLVEGDDAAARGDKVLAETSTGSHATACQRWERAAGAKLPHPDFLRSWFTLPDLRSWPYAR